MNKLSLKKMKRREVAKYVKLDSHPLIWSPYLFLRQKNFPIK